MRPPALVATDDDGVPAVGAPCGLEDAADGRITPFAARARARRDHHQSVTRSEGVRQGQNRPPVRGE